MADSPETESDVSPPSQDGDDPSALFSQQVFTQQFEIAQSIGRILESLKVHDDQFDGLKSDIEAVKSEVAQVGKEFGYIRKSWWIFLVLLGFMLKVGYDDLVKPALTTDAHVTEESVSGEIKKTSGA